jgi:hypothetical protein
MGMGKVMICDIFINVSVLYTVQYINVRAEPETYHIAAPALHY